MIKLYKLLLNFNNIYYFKIWINDQPQEKRSFSRNQLRWF